LCIELCLDGHDDVDELASLGPVHERWPFVVVCSLLNTRMGHSAHNLDLWSNRRETSIQYPRYKSMININKTMNLQFQPERLSRDRERDRDSPLLSSGVGLHHLEVRDALLDVLNLESQPKFRIAILVSDLSDTYITCNCCAYICCWLA
jgi:hypothetical protein